MPPSPMMEDVDFVPGKAIVERSGPTLPSAGGTGSPGRGREVSSKSSQVGMAGDKKQGVCVCVCVHVCVSPVWFDV